jgi:membrane protease YdiL (CAAX protease family)
MVIASILVSVPFAAMHAEQQGYALGPFVLLILVSLVLCAIRLQTRSLAASVVVHSTYNFLLFAVMVISTGGFKHLDKM